MACDRVSRIPVSCTNRSCHVAVIYPFFSKAAYEGIASTCRVHGVNNRGLDDFASFCVGPHRTTRAQSYDDIRDARSQQHISSLADIIEGVYRHPRYEFKLGLVRHEELNSADSLKIQFWCDRSRIEEYWDSQYVP